MDLSENAGTSGRPSRRAVVSAAGAAGVIAVLRPGIAEAATATRPPAPARAARGLIRGGVRQYARPRIAPGYRLVLPASAVILPGGGTASTPAAWPHAPRGGRAVDLGEMAPGGSPTQAAVLAGFGNRGWYEIRDPQGRLVDRRDWNAIRLPYLRLNQEWGANTAHPYWGAFYCVRLEPVSLAV